MRAILQALIVGVGLMPGIGCTTIASSLGFSPPVHKLTETAEAFRMAAVAPAPLPTELSKGVVTAYIVEPGDVLSVEPVEFDSPVRLPADQPILLDGTIDLGQYGRPMVAGKTVAEIEPLVRQLINAKLTAEEQKNALVTVRLVARESKVYYVLGEVNSPRAFPLAGRETVLDGILAAGGLTRQADQKKIILSRPSRPEGCRVVLPICYLDIVQLGDTSTNYQLQPGDRIYVASQGGLDDFKKLFHRNRDDCGPCHTPQVPCLNGTGTCAPAGGVMPNEAVPQPAPFGPALPHTP